MGGTFYSNCSTITTGCYIYNDIYKTSPASNGYYSDGINCYTVEYGNGYVFSVASCTTPLYININGPSAADSTGETGSGNVQVASQSVSYWVDGNYVNVASTLTIDAICYASTTSPYPTDLNYIFNGDSCETGFLFAGMSAFETIDGYAITGVSPSSDSTYTYNIGNGFRDSTYTC